MRNFNVCSAFVNENNGGMRNKRSNACFSHIQSYMNPNNPTPYMLIFDFRDKATEKYIPVLVKTMNEITPCSLVTIDNVEYIKFKLFGTYDQSLVLLNFIRNLWNVPGACTLNYNITFFETLKKSRYKDPFKRLTKANMVACKLYYQSKGTVGHSNCHGSGFLVIRDLNHLMKNKFGSTRSYLI